MMFTGIQFGHVQFYDENVQEKNKEIYCRLNLEMIAVAW